MIQILEQLPVKKKKEIYCRVWKIWSRMMTGLHVFSMYCRHITSAYMLFLIFCQKTLHTASFREKNKQMLKAGRRADLMSRQPLEA